MKSLFDNALYGVNMPIVFQLTDGFKKQKFKWHEIISHHIFKYALDIK